MASAGARAQKPVGSAAWISTEKENISQLVEQEMEEVEYPVSHEMDWLNEHMAEIFNNQFNFTEAFKTPGKLRGKTPRTARKRNFEESRMPLSEIFSTAHNLKENKSIASPTGKRSPAKPAAPIPTTTTTKPATENAPQPQYPDLSQNLNSFPQYNTDSGYHGMTDDDGGGDDEGDDDDDDDDVVLTQTQPESQTSTQPSTQALEEKEPTPEPPQAHDPVHRRRTESSFHSAQEESHQRGETLEPANDAANIMHKVEVHPPKLQLKETKPEEKHVSRKPEFEQKRGPERAPEKMAEKESARKQEQKQKPKPKSKPMQEQEQEQEQERQRKQDLDSESEQESEPEQQPEPQPEPEPAQTTKSSPVHTPATQPLQPLEEDNDVEMDKEDMALDNLEVDDDIGSPSDGSTPERPPIRKSSLTFASLPAREPLTKKSLGGARVSRTSHIGSGFFGRQTGGHRTTQAALDENASQGQGEKMDVDDDAEPTREVTNADTRASKQHNKSSTQRLHEKISMLGKLQPSRPTKSIPSVSGLSSAQVSYPDLPPVSKTETKPEASDRKSRETPAPEPIMATDEEEWIKPSLNTPQRPNLAKSRTMDVMERTANQASEKDDASTACIPGIGDNQIARSNENHSAEMGRPKSTTPLYTPPQHPSHQKSASVSNLTAGVSTTPAGSPKPQDIPLSASKWKLQSIMKSAKGLFSNAGGVSAAAKDEDSSSPTESRRQPEDRVKPPSLNLQEPQPAQESTPPRPEGRRTRSSTEREEKRRQQEIEEREREEQEEEKAREQEKQKAIQLKAAREKASLEREERAASIAPSPKKVIPQPQKHTLKDPEITYETASKSAAPSSIPQQKPNERRPVKPTRETLQKPKPQPVSIRVGSALSRQIPMASGSNVQESAASAPTPASASKPSAIKKASNTSLHTASSNNSLKSSVSSNSQRKVQLASERKREQEEREARRKEEQRREMERKRAAQQQEEARRQELRSRAEAERRERQASVDPKKAAHMQAIEKRRLENARRLERQGSQQPNDTSSLHQPERPASQASRPASRLGSIQPFGRSINTPQPNPAKPPKRAMDDEAGHRPAPPKPSILPQAGDPKRRRTEDEHNPPPSVRPAMAPPIRQSNIRKELTKPSIFNGQRTSTAPQSGSSILKTAQPQRAAHHLDMSKYASGKIPFAEPSNASQPKPVPSSAQKAATKQSPKYPSGENIQLPEIATDSEDEDSDAEILPVPKWAQPRELENLLRQQEGMEVDSIFGPVAPFSLEDTFKADKKIKKFRERTSSANWSGADRLTQDEIRKDLAERQRLRLNGGWTFDSN